MSSNRANGTPASSSWRSTLPIHPATELFPRMPPDELRALGEDIIKKGLTSPIVLWQPDSKSPARLLDGISRLDAIEIATGSPVIVGAPSIMAGQHFLVCDKVIVLDGKTDPYAFVVSANIHRRHLTAEQKRELIAKLIKATPEKSDRQIAETVKASPTTVGTVRAEMEAKGDVSKLDTRRDSKGREQPAARTSGRKKKTTTKREMKELKEATGKQKQKVTNDIVCLIAELINAHGKGMEMFVRQCLIEYAKEIAHTQSNWGTEFARLVLTKLNIAADDEMPGPSTEMPDIPDFLRRTAS
jgi:hypothetical protein